MGGNAEATGDHLVTHALRDKGQDFRLAWGQHRRQPGQLHADIQALGDRVDRGQHPAGGDLARQHAGDGMVRGQREIVAEDDERGARQVAGQRRAGGKVKHQHVSRPFLGAVQHRFELPGAPRVGDQQSHARPLGRGHGTDGGFDHGSHA